MIRFVEVLNKTDKNPRMERVASLEFELGEVWIALADGIRLAVINNGSGVI